MSYGTNLSEIRRQLAETVVSITQLDRQIQLELAASAADLTGIVDPTPASDIVSAGLAIYKGDWVGAGLSIVSIVPYAGDAVAKPIKAGRATRTLAKLQAQRNDLERKAAALRDVEKQLSSVKPNSTTSTHRVNAEVPTTDARRSAAEQKGAKDTDCESCGPAGAAPKFKHTMPLKKVEPCFSSRNLDPSRAAEFEVQLKAQEDALNRLSVAEFEKARSHFKANKRAGTGKAQQQARKRFSDDLIKTLQKEYSRTMAPREAKNRAIERANEVMKDLAALHEPDMIAGGKDVVTSLGDRSVNSSIGSQWRSRVSQLDAAAASIPLEKKGATRMNVKLPKC